MGASDIKAGSAYVEIGAKTQPFEAALGKVKAGLSSLLGSFAAMGAGIAGLGAAMMAPLVSSIHVFAEYGEHIAKIATKTGMSADTLSGLAYAAKQSNVNVGALTGAVKALRKSGLTADDFLPAVDAISQIPDANDRATAAMKKFGRSGMELLPMIENGSAEIKRMMEEARTLGLIMGSPAKENAEKLSAAFKRMDSASEALKLHIGAALAPMFTELADRFVDVVIFAKDWIDQNPELVQSFARCAVAVTAAGVAMTTLAGAVFALMSPILLTTVGIAGIGMALLAVLDVVGVWHTGFGDLFNSIRLGTHGLGTWMGEVSLYLQKAWNFLWDSMSDGFSFVVHEAQKAATYLIQAWVFIPQKILEGFSVMANGIAASFNKMIEAYNFMASKVGGSEIKFRFSTEGGALSNAAKAFGGIGEGAANYRGSLDRSFSKDGRDTDAYRRQRDRMLGQDIDKTWAKDTEKSSFGIDTGKLKSSLLGIVNNGWDWAGKAIGAATINIPHHDWQKITNDADGAGAKKAEAPKLSAVGTFSAFGGGGLAATGIFNQQLAEHKKTNEHLSQIKRSVSGSMSGVYAP